MARSKGLSDWNISYIRFKIAEQNLTVVELCEKIDVSEQHLSRVLNGHSPLSEDIGRSFADTLGVPWDVVKQPESNYLRGEMVLWIMESLKDRKKLEPKNVIRLADKMGFLSGGQVDSGEPSAAEVEDAELLELGDTPEVDL